MHIDSTSPGMVWNIYLSTFSTPKAIVAIEVKIEGDFIVQEWNARSVRNVLLGKATTKIKDAAYKGLLDKLLGVGFITQASFDAAPKTFS
jgi:hypothetical protein